MASAATFLLARCKTVLQHTHPERRTRPQAVRPTPVLLFRGGPRKRHRTMRGCALSNPKLHADHVRPCLTALSRVPDCVSLPCPVLCPGCVSVGVRARASVRPRAAAAFPGQLQRGQRCSRLGGARRRRVGVHLSRSLTRNNSLVNQCEMRFSNNSV